ncbi:hypothetical protein AVEN_213341-1 [Araneus ventricosus]|uniref:Uncharacterized protein n=1 Tax=Araneus ventricosus TaxID=182803 RepID=A0A4Y2VIG1_ARAVE|nr:hypothetical protein AVEN_213341-1 [Araneus ventricosus]
MLKKLPLGSMGVRPLILFLCAPCNRPKQATGRRPAKQNPRVIAGIRNTVCFSYQRRSEKKYCPENSCVQEQTPTTCHYKQRFAQSDVESKSHQSHTLRITRSVCETIHRRVSSPLLMIKPVVICISFLVRRRF